MLVTLLAQGKLRISAVLLGSGCSELQVISILVQKPELMPVVLSCALLLDV